MRKIVAALLLSAVVGGALAQTYPTRPVHIIVPFPPGGSADVLARVLAPKMAASLGQPVVVENKPGASANIGAEFVARATPDGYTLLLGTPALGVSAAVFTNLTYEAQRDLMPVGLLTVFPSVLVVHPSVPANTPQEFVAHAKANPGKLNFASTGNTSAIRFAFEHFRQITGIDAVHIPYKGSAPAAQAMLAGETQVMMATLADALPHIRAGKLRPLAATGAKRIAAIPDVPTLAETVVPGFDYLIWHGLLAPTGTPPAVIQKLNQSVNDALRQADVTERLTGIGMEMTPGTPQDLGKLIAEEVRKWGEVARTANIKAE